MGTVLNNEWVEGLIGQQLTEDEARVLDWLRGWEKETNLTVLLLIEKAYKFGQMKKCETCNGEGGITVETFNDPVSFECPDCNGTGEQKDKESK